MSRVLPSLFIGALAFGAATALQAQAKPPRSAPEAYFNTTPISEGRVERFLIDPYGEVDGLLLQSGVLVHFPPHMSDQLTAAVRPGDTVSVYGIPESQRSMKAFIIADLRSNQRVVEEPPNRLVPRLPPQLRGLALKPLTAEGQIRLLLSGRRSDINGVLLADGTVVRFPPNAAFQLGPLLQVGQTFAATGYGSENEFGRALEATAIGGSASTLQALYNVGPRR
jgi:hypothetical protein